MEHILEDVQVFQNFYASLKKGGALLISTPSDQGGSDAHEHEHDETSGFIDEHVRDGYNKKEIEEKLKAAGFKDIETRYAYGTPGKLSWKLSMKYPIQLLGTSKLFYAVLPFYYVAVFPFMIFLNLSRFKQKSFIRDRTHRKSLQVILNSPVFHSTAIPFFEKIEKYHQHHLPSSRLSELLRVRWDWLFRSLFLTDSTG